MKVKCVETVAGLDITFDRIYDVVEEGATMYRIRDDTDRLFGVFKYRFEIQLFTNVPKYALDWRE